MARFSDRATRPARGPQDILRWRWEKLRAAAPAQVDAPANVRFNDGGAIRDLGASLTWVGHASFLLKLGGVLAAIDPVFSDRLGGLVKRLAPPGIALAAVPQKIQIVCITHNHRDHLDLPTLARIGPEATYVVPLGNGRLLTSAGLTRVIELDWWQSHREGALEITLVPARHWSMRFPWDRDEMLWGGFVLRGPEGCVYHSGDTGFFDGFQEIGGKLGPIDWALLPIGAYEPRWFMQPQHISPEEAGEAFKMLGARTFVAMHWGTFKLTDEPTGEPPQRIREYWRAQALEAARLWLMDIGETRALEPR